MRRFVLMIGVLGGALGCGNKAAVGEDAMQGVPMCANPVTGGNVVARQIGRVVGGAMLATSPPNDPRLFVIEQRGAIRIFNAEQLLPDPFLDLSADAGGPVIAGGENGLLGLAFHPQYATNGEFFVFYTARGGPAQRDVVARCTVSAADPNRADAASCVDVLSIPDFAGNHNGGMIEFAADGTLVIGTGDGGGGGDPQRTGQDLTSLLGKMLRIDVDARTNGEYGIPAGNPFAAGGGRPEIFMLGLRNPWRWSFDRGTGDIWIGDVGQGQIEELNVVRAGQQAGVNFGWSVYEGSNCCMTTPDRCTQGDGATQACDTPNLFAPQDERSHDDGWISIIAGQTYRGSCYPDLVGWHLYTDYDQQHLVKARLRTDGSLEVVDLPGPSPHHTSSIHADSRGELYLTTDGGNVYHLEAAP